MIPNLLKNQSEISLGIISERLESAGKTAGRAN